MKKTILALITVAVLASCSGSKEGEQNSKEETTAAAAGEKFGAAIDENGAIALA